MLSIAVHRIIHRVRLRAAGPVHLLDFLLRGDHLAMKHFIHKMRSGAAPLDVRKSGTKGLELAVGAVALGVLDLKSSIGKCRRHVVEEDEKAQTIKLGKIARKVREERSPPGPGGP